MSTAPKHQPATPLPWLHDVPPRSLPNGQHKPEDFHFARHAANAYPKLVEALRELNQSVDTYAEAGNVALNEAWIKARDFLRELGETE